MEGDKFDNENMDDLNEMVNLHSAGATVRHASPFDSLQSHKNEFDLTADFTKKWVVPFYMRIGMPDDGWISEIKTEKSQITKEISLSLLGDFNWRTRLVGAYFSAINTYSDLIDLIGIHLLKSEVCCVGHTYALTLCSFNTDKSVYYLESYLGYYLKKPQLGFDQNHVMSALFYLDKVNDTKNSDKFMEDWRSLQKTWGRQNEELTSTYFENQVKIIKEIQN